MLGRSLASDRRGAIAVLVAVGMTVLLGMSAFAIDLGAAYSQKARLQNVADSAALAGAIVWVKTGSAAQVKTTVQDVVVANTSTWGITITQSITNPTTSVPSVTVRLTAPSTLKLARVLTSATSVTTTGISVASVVPATVTACVVSLTIIQLNGAINAGNCAVAANSSANNSINANSGGSITATNIDTPGTINPAGTMTGTVNTGAASDVGTNPYSSMQSTEASQVNSCPATYTNYTNQTTQGCYTNANIGSAITLTAGTYVFSNLNINSGGSISGTNVTLILTGSNVSLGGNGISITAPTTTSWAGMAIYATGSLTFNSNTPFAINGAIYVPNGILTLDSGASNQAKCTFIVANSLTWNASSSFNLPQTNCIGYPPPKTPGGSQVKLTQ